MGAELHDVDDVKGMPTTQRAVAQAIFSSEIANDPAGYRCVFANNRDASAELAIFLCKNQFHLQTT